MYGNGVRLNGEKGKEKNDERILERAVIIGPYAAQIRETKSWHEVIRDCKVQEFWCIQKPAILNEHTTLNNSTSLSVQKIRVKDVFCRNIMFVF